MFSIEVQNDNKNVIFCGDMVMKLYAVILKIISLLTFSSHR